MINQKRLVDTFINLAKIDIPTGEEREIAGYVCKLLEGKSIKCYRDKLSNVVINIQGKGTPLLFSAHLDTVEPGRGVRPIIKNGEITSDGKTILGADNKVAVAAIIEAICVFHENKLDTKPLDIIFTVSEESGSYGVLGLDYSKIMASEGYIFDMSRNVGTIITASPFYDRFDIEIIGRSSHASLPKSGINVLSILRDSLNSIRLGRISKNTLVNIGTLKAGDARNTVPDRAVVAGEVRSFSEKEQNSALQKIKRIFETASQKYKVRIKFASVRENRGYSYKQDDRLVINAISAIKKQNINSVLLEEYGCSDANVFIEKGIRVINLGNGAKNAHTTREKVRIQDMIKISKLILSLSIN